VAESEGQVLRRQDAADVDDITTVVEEVDLASI
jgi:hypothetical protein